MCYTSTGWSCGWGYVHLPITQGLLNKEVNWLSYYLRAEANY